MKDFKCLGSGQANSQKDLIKITRKATTVALKFELPKIIKKEEGVNGVNRLATKGHKILLTTDITKKKLPTSDKIINWDLQTTDKGRNF